ncbi:MAG: efflux RND transporter periplasmic adaptor subunit [Porticoccaceae bacterium]
MSRFSTTQTMRRDRTWRFTDALLCLVLGLIGCSAPEEPPPAPPAVGVVRLTPISVPLDLSYTARTRGEREVEVRARVSGILEKRYYQEGATVEAGALLFRIDPAPFAAAVRSAEGRLGIEQARLVEAELQRERVRRLVERGFSADRERDLAEAAYASAKAAVAASEAELEQARLNLAYTEVRAPIAGITGREARSEGSLIAADGESSLLTTIAQSDRLYIDFAVPEDEARLVREALSQQPDKVSVRLSTGNGTTLPDDAGIEFIDTRVHGDTGTVEVRATLHNSSGALAPGQFVRASVEGLHTDVGIYVPARAVLHSADGPFVWTLDAQNLVQFQPVTLGLGVGNLLEVHEGLGADDRVIVDGVLKVQPGAPVVAEEVALESLPAAVGSNS